MADDKPQQAQPPQGQPQQTQKPADQKPPGRKPDEKDKPSPFRNPLVLVVGGIVLAAVAVGALLFWLDARRYEGTDDAFVDVQIVRVAPQIAGQVIQVLVTDNQAVQPGQPLVKIDSADAQTRVAEAAAKRAQAQAQVDNARVQVASAADAYAQARADVAAAKAQADKAASDLGRYTSVQRADPGAVAQQEVDQAIAQARSANAQLAGAQKAASTRADQVQAAKTQVDSGEQQVKAAESELQAADINLGYASLAAPMAGTIAQKTVAPGNYVQPGTQLMAIVPLQVWITANYKETQLDLMRPGQAVQVKVDACPHARIEGRVDSIQRGAGQAFAILPPENATGNYVKVVQRVPVKIVLDQVPRDCPLGPGMSVQPKVKVR